MVNVQSIVHKSIIGRFGTSNMTESGIVLELDHYLDTFSPNRAVNFIRMFENFFFLPSPPRPQSALFILTLSAVLPLLNQLIADFMTWVV